MLQYCHITYPHFLFLVRCQLVASHVDHDLSSTEQKWGLVSSQVLLAGHSLNQNWLFSRQISTVVFFHHNMYFSTIKS